MLPHPHFVVFFVSFNFVKFVREEVKKKKLPKKNPRVGNLNYRL